MGTILRAPSVRLLASFLAAAVAGLVPGGTFRAYAGPPVAARIAIRFDRSAPVAALSVTRTVLARRLSGPPRVDGRLDDPAWRSAAELKDLSRTGSAAPAYPRTKARVGHYGGFLYVSAQCDEPDQRRRTAAPARARDRRIWNGDCLQILLDPRLARATVYAIVVNPGGAVADYRVIGRQKDLNWDSECVAAAEPNESGWGVEVRVPRKALAAPDNDMIGFNIVRRRPGTEGEPFAWDPAPRFFESGAALGTLAFQKRVCSIQKIELGWPRVGLNRFRVWLRNDSPEERWVRAGLVTRFADGKTDQSKYRVKLPPGKVTVAALTHRIGAAGTCDLAFAIADDASGEWLARVSRPGLDVAGSALRTMRASPQPIHGRFSVYFRIDLPVRELAGLGLRAVVREKDGYRVLGKAAARQPRSRSGVIALDVAGMAAGAYRLDVYLVRKGGVLAKVREEFAVPAAKEEPGEQQQAE